jgi:alpha-amylase/alpha-mannosidase (GH57 family)
MKKYVCIHGHFYQPPRENPWLEAIEVQDSASPYRDWNERITAECYNPNTAARILENNYTIIDIINNYSKISFNFGPTLLSWMETSAPDVYKAIIRADKESRKHFSGHGSAIAQNYGHTIMPLNNTRDKKTQIIWGIEDFVHRFGREPEGMWLAETAVNNETLELLAEKNIKFTILAPRQAAEVKHINDKKWTDVSDESIDPKKAYLCNLPSGRKINLFFYDGAISQDLAFGNLLENGENLAQRLLGTFNNDDYPQIAHIATDGETYGHHQKHGDMALAYCLHYIEADENTSLTVYGEFLEKFPPEYEVKIIEDTSWSCLHGVKRWYSNCGCNSGRPDWHQEWRAPLRESLDWLREKLSLLYEKETSIYTEDMWGLRDNYIKIILNRNPDNIKTFLAENSIKDLKDEELVKLLKLLELQRHAMLMYTSCGWFFDEISGIETVQVILYAARAIQLAKEITGEDFEPEFIGHLEKIKSNIPELDNGAAVYERYVKPAIIDLLRVAAHYAVSALFEEYSEHSNIFCYEVTSKDYELLSAGKTHLAMGRAVMRSMVTYEEILITHAFFHLGDHNLNGGVREARSMKDYDEMKKEFKDVFEKMNVSEIIFLIDKHFGTHSYSLWHLFKDESRKVFNKLMQETLTNIEISFRQIYENHYPMMLAMLDTETPLPKAIVTAVEFVLNTDIRKILDSPDPVDSEHLHRLTDEAKKWNIGLDKNIIGYSASKRINEIMEKLMKDPDNIQLLIDSNILLGELKKFNLPLDLWKAQNTLFLYSKNHLRKNDGKPDEWYSHFNELEKHLEVSIM